MPEHAQTIFRKKSRSFSLAAKLLTPETREDVARLYQFCRYIDDLADASMRGKPEHLGTLASELETDRQKTNDPVLNDFLELAKERSLPLEAARELVEASQTDCGPRRLQTEADLIRFAYGVAGTVGLLMCPLIGANDPRSTPFAIDLGIALQLTNIARDVAGDADRQRFYLPAEWVSPETVQRALKSEDPGAVRKVDQAVEKTLNIADHYYGSALLGHWFIPRRNRKAIFFALNFYRSIGEKMRRSGSGAWRKRTRLGLTGKLAAGISVWPHYRTMEHGLWSQNEPPRHSEYLHIPLKETGS